jgi:hypothetical protein
MKHTSATIVADVKRFAHQYGRSFRHTHGSLLSSSLPAFARGASFQAIDSNCDGVLDLDEIKKAASAKFDALDRNRTGTLSRREIGRLRLSRKDFAAGDPDKDGTLTKDECLAIVEQRFKAADTNHKGTSASQSSTPGQACPCGDSFTSGPRQPPSRSQALSFQPGYFNFFCLSWS